MTSLDSTKVYGGRISEDTYQANIGTILGAAKKERGLSNLKATGELFLQSKSMWDKFPKIGKKSSVVGAIKATLLLASHRLREGKTSSVEEGHLEALGLTLFSASKNIKALKEVAQLAESVMISAIMKSRSRKEADGDTIL